MALRILQLALIWFITLTVPAFAQQQQRVALVIGNGAYIGSLLSNPVKDAKAISAKLSDMGFNVTTLLNVNRSQLGEALASFQVTSKDSDTTVLFYAGHGAVLDGIPYLVPIDATLETSTSLRNSSVSLGIAVAEFMSGRRKIILLDSSLANPYRESSGQHLMMPTPSGALIAYATEVGFSAADGPGQNSPFTTALIERIGQHDDVAVVLRQVRDSVIKATNGQQRPWFSDAIWYCSWYGNKYSTT
jgi:uncharacterized caspase-like protein